MLTLLVASLFVAQPVVTETLDGNKSTGNLVELSNEGLVLMDSDGRQQRIPIERMLRISRLGKPAATAAGLGVSTQLLGGSTIRARGFSDSSGESTFRLGQDSSVSVSTKSVRWVRWWPDGSSYDQAWQKTISQNAQSDRVVIRRPEGVLDYFEGTIQGVDDKDVQFEFDGESLSVARERLEGIIYFHSATSELPSAVCQLRDSSGSSWELAEFELKDEDITFTTRAGVVSQLPWNRVARMDFSGGNLVYLSDLTPQSIQWTPFFAGDALSDNARRLFHPRLDRGFHRDSLRLRFPDEERPIREYPKGISIQSRTEMIYRLPDGFQRFKAWAGIDMDVSPAGSVQLTISGDNELLYDEELRGGGSPEEIDVSVDGVRRLRIFVDFADNLAMGDQLNLCNPRITK